MIKQTETVRTIPQGWASLDDGFEGFCEFCSPSGSPCGVCGRGQLDVTLPVACDCCGRKLDPVEQLANSNVPEALCVKCLRAYQED